MKTLIFHDKLEKIELKREKEKELNIQKYTWINSKLFQVVLVISLARDKILDLYIKIVYKIKHLITTLQSKLAD